MKYKYLKTVTFYHGHILCHQDVNMHISNLILDEKLHGSTDSSSVNFRQTRNRNKLKVRKRLKKEGHSPWGWTQRIQPLRHLFNLFTDSTFNWAERRIDFYCNTTEEKARLHWISLMTITIQSLHKADYIQTLNW